MAKKRKSKRPRPSNDDTREALIEFLYSRREKARGVKSLEVKIRAVKKELKSRGYTEQEIVRNLDYLIQTAHIIEVKRSYPLRRSGKTIQVEDVSYKLSDFGVDHFEGPSRFQRVRGLTGINIENLETITIVGEGTIVNAQHSELFLHLDVLKSEIGRNDVLSDEEKLNSQAEVETIKSQLQKTEPDRAIIRKAWERIHKLGAVSGIASFITNIAPFLTSLLG